MQLAFQRAACWQILFVFSSSLILVFGWAGLGEAALAPGAEEILHLEHDEEAHDVEHDEEDHDDSDEGPEALQLASHWTRTATSGLDFTQGNPTTLTWSFVPDGTTINSGVGEPVSGSSLISFLDGLHGAGPGGSDLTLRPWFPIFNTSFNRIAELSGITYVYEDDDDGVVLSGSTSSAVAGVLNTRGDVRIGAHPISGINGGVLAYNYLPNGSDMVLDTQDPLFFDANDIRFRNIIQHEAGHGLGLRHVEPVNGTKLLEPFITSQFEGPQIDDIQAIHRHYGDFFEKSNGGAGNNVFGNSTPLGVVSIGSTVSIGTDANDAGTAIEVFVSESDFISIDDNSDIDYLSFTLPAAAIVDLTLTPAGGPIYEQGADNTNGSNNDPTAPFDPTAQSDLTLSLFDTTGIGNLVTVNDAALGSAEVISNQILAAGTYYARITGQHNATQLYQLDVFASAVPEPTTFLFALMGLVAASSIRRHTR